jgi:aminoglycoside 6'-N-acetyltransferase I
LSNRYGLEIRAAGSAEAVGLAELLAQGGTRVSSQEVAERLETMRSYGGTVLVALEWGPPSGVVVMHRYVGLSLAKPSAQISLLLVAEDARRRGIGRLLIKAASQAARVAGCGSLEVTAGVGRADLRAFCLNTGFEESGAVFARGLRKSGIG